MIAETKACLSCSKIIRGRTDKKFCNDHCRNTHNNRLNSDSNRCIRAINYHLRRNRRILENALPMPRTSSKTSKHKLFTKGYRFNYFTHTYTDRQGKLFHFCYDYGYVLLDKDQVLVVRRKNKEEDE